MDIFTLYLITVVPQIGAAIGFTAIFGVIGLVTYGVLGYLETNENKFKEVKGWFFALIVAGVLSAFVPSERGLYTMIGVYAVTNVEGVEDIPPNLVKAANEYLTKYAEETEK